MPFVHKCNICSATFSNMAAAWEHYSDMHIKKQYVCSLCPNEYADSGSLNAHWLVSHKDIPDMKMFVRNIEMVSLNRKMASKLFFALDFVLHFQADSKNKILPQLFTETIAPSPKKVAAGKNPTAGASNVTNGKPKNEKPKHNTGSHLLSDSAHCLVSDDSSDTESIPDSEEFNKHAQFIAECVAFIEYYKYMKAGKFDCHVCYKKFASRSSLIQHVLNMHNTLRLPNVLKVQKNSVQRKIITKFKGNFCLFCPRDYKSRQQVTMHFKQDHGIVFLNCPNALCDGVFWFENNLRDHIRKCEHGLAKNPRVF